MKNNETELKRLESWSMEDMFGVGWSGNFEECGQSHG